MRQRRNWLYLLFALLIAMAYPVTVYGEDMDSDGGGKTLAPYFFIEGGDGRTDSFPLKETDVLTTINGVIAETYVTQTYANEGTEPINASYVFPASAKVAVHGMTMEIGDQLVTARIREREEAKEEFEEAKSEGKSASLLEQQRPNVFTMDVANIMPGDTARIELHYTELISSTDGAYEFVFPTVVGPRYASPSGDQSAETDQWVASPYQREGETPSGTYNITVRLSTGVPISSLASPSHKIDIARDEASSAQVTLAHTEEYAGNRDFILDYKLTGQEIQSGLMLNTGEKENFFLLMVQPPERCKPEDIPPREYVFILDVSGSMFGYPLDTAKELIKDLVSGLRTSDTFNLILFSGVSYEMSPVSVPATEENIQRAIRLIESPGGAGGTELAPALKNAIAMPKDDSVSRSIVTITDGYISGEKEIFDIIRENLDTTSFFSFGIGDSVNRYLIDGIAKTGLGESFVVTDPADAADTARRFRTYIQSPILTDIHVAYEGFDVYDTEPAALPTLFAQRPIILFGKWRGQPSGTIRITGKSGSQDYSQEIQVSGVTPLETNNALPYLWARTRVEQLSDYGSGEEEQDAVRKEVTQLGLDYSMMTPYTSFVAVIDTIRNKDGQSTDVKQPLPLPLHVSDLAVGGGYMSGSEPGDMILISMAVSIAAIGVLVRRRRRLSPAAGGAKDGTQ